MKNTLTPLESDKGLKRRVMPAYSGGLDLSAPADALEEKALSEAVNLSFSSLPAITQRHDRTRFTGGIETPNGMGARDDGKLNIMNGRVWSLWDGQYLTAKYTMPTDAPTCFARFSSEFAGTQYIALSDTDSPRSMSADGTVIQVMSDAPAGRLAAAFGDRLFIARGRRLYYSKAGDHTVFSSGDAGSLLHNTSDGDITALAPHGDRLLVFTLGSCYELHGKNASYELRRVDLVGCVGDRAVCSDGGALYFAGPEGVYIYTGATPKKISQRIQPHIDAMNRAAWGETALGAQGGRLYVSIPTGESAAPDLTLVYDGGTETWRREDTAFRLYAKKEGTLHAISSDRRLFSFGRGTTGYDTYGGQVQPIAWSLTSRPYRLCETGASFTVRVMDIGYALAQDASMILEVSAGGEFERVYAFEPAQRGLASILLPMGLGRLRSLALRFSGTGAFMIDGVRITSREWGA